VFCSGWASISLIISFFFLEFVFDKKSAGQLGGGGVRRGAHPLHPPPRSAPDHALN